MNDATEVIQDLLAAAVRLGLNPTTTVKTSSDGFFGFSLIVPDEVDDMAAVIRIERAGVAKDSKPAESELTESEPEPAPKKRGRPRKAAAEPVQEEQE
jgi:hypothetical protein